MRGDWRFGRAEVYQLASTEAVNERRDKLNALRRGRQLFSRPLTYAQLDSYIRAGAKVKSTAIKADFTYEDFLVRYGKTALVLFRIDELGKLHIATSDTPLYAKPGQKLISLVSETGELIG